MNTPASVATAIASSCLYFVGFVLFKNAAATMPQLRGTRPLHFAATVLSSGVWLSGGLVMGVGVALQLAVLPRLSLAVLVSALLCGLVVLLFLAFFVSGERTTAAETRSLVLMAGAGLTIAWSGPGTPPSVPGPLLALVAVLSLLVPVLIFSLGDTRPEGQHARPLTGIAYGLSAGTLIGLAELALGLQSRAGPTVSAALLGLLFLLAVACGVAQLQIALQRCRMVIVVFVATVVAKSYLVIASGLLCLGSPVTPFSSPWLLPPGLALIAAALLFAPHYEARRLSGAGPAAPAPAPRTGRR